MAHHSSVSDPRWHSMPGQDREVRPAGPSLAGSPVRFVGGQFAGRTLRAVLNELQKADLGRKYARKDRRPLDPPPVVQFQLFEVSNAGTPSQTEQEFEDYDAIKSFGVLCHVDLFPVPDQDGDQSDGSAESTASQASASTFHAAAFSAPSPALGPSRTCANPYHSGFSPPPSPGTYVMPQLMPSSLAHHMHSIPASAPDVLPYPLPTGTAPLLQPFSMVVAAPLPDLSIPGAIPEPMSTASPVRGQSPPGPFDPDIIAYMGDFAIRESSKCTTDLVGATFVQSSGLEYKGRKALMFVFSDLAVKTEGTFILRYRVFNIFSRASAVDIPILAQCFGGPFKIYPSKEFPGLRASTDLTKHISHFGVRLNLRETERKRRRRSKSPVDRSQDSATPSSGASSSSATTSSSDRSESRARAGSVFCARLQQPCGISADTHGALVT
ncbi:velvet factor-domain-containing protein [Fomitopsis serialis]|uniref:velvet factor-domain-containing protein n=1 Tax=Fomitopsis serialis TaxID=139415 RepID=UPI0020076BC4|nr:velvet factor-domain-containing protein [Neoantrodia serialis]KAH9914102.1 velvet factor-domain-containing protein [Neoantrodia serialis]